MNITFGYYPEGRKKALTLSYDDGLNYDRKLIEIFNKYGMKGTFHLVSGKFDLEEFVSSAEVKELYSGHEVSSHSYSHPYLTHIPQAALLEEMLEDRKQLEKLVGYPVRGMSYPYGDYNEELIKTLPELGIEYSRTTESHKKFNLPDNFLKWHPTCHHSENLLETASYFINQYDQFTMPLLYVWGHSFEFGRINDWKVIDEFCKMASDNNSIWYATNIEVKDYVCALKNLRFGVEQKTVYNPTALRLWIGVDYEPLEIGPGETITL